MTLEEMLEQVIALLVGTFDVPEAEARQRVDLWRAQQHQLEGEALEAILPHQPPEEALRQILGHVLEGEAIRERLERGADQLGL